MEAIEHNNTWKLTDLPKGHKIIGVKWVYKTKLKENGEVDKYKARFVAKSYKQEFGVDYKAMFAPVTRHDTIRLMIVLTTQNSWPIFKLDVKLAFLHGDLKEQEFVDQPPGYVKHGNDNKMGCFMVPKKQPIITLSTTEAEFAAARTCVSQAIWSEDQVADIFTNSLNIATFQKLRKLLGICTLEDLLV
ncbi:hypothetical protein CXB51_001865 [Gossypium anomalum]|uniref:Reverse transcriptase Ty1/copia-type domain-containing protein n=1 Tax=Gossypium anomalum TaxID=47600 RepID=A0A8J5ZLP5_9ROSI|nr:hypothetical protein CXB51_001865 [Gossypium anomalum]